MGGAISGFLGTDSGSNGMSTDQATTNLQPNQAQFNGVLAQQGQLAGQLQAQANGTGPNPALAQLNQTTQQTGQQAASTIASQRGMNAGLAARTSAQNQAVTQQQAAGQAASMTAQQQIAAQSNLSNLYGTEASGINGQEGAINSAGQINAGLTQGNQQIASSAVSGIAGGAGSAFGKLAHGGVVHQKMASGGSIEGQTITPPQVQQANAGGPSSNVGQYLNQMKTGNGQATGINQQDIQKLGKGIKSYFNKTGTNTAASPTSTASNGVTSTDISSPNTLTDSNAAITNQDTGLAQQGTSAPVSVDAPAAVDTGGADAAGAADAGAATDAAAGDAAAAGATDAAAAGATDAAAAGAAGASSDAGLLALLARGGYISRKKMAEGGPMDTSTPLGNFEDSIQSMLAKGGKVPVLLSPGEKVLKPSAAKAVAKGKANPMAMGATVPGQAKVKGDSYANDTFATSLPPGAIVIPRHITQSKDAPKKAAAFVAAHLKSLGTKRK